MIDINPFCDSNIRSGFQFLSGVNLIVIGISIVVDTLAVIELLEFSETWDYAEFYLPAYTGYALLGSDILLNLLQLLCGWSLYSSVMQKSYGKLYKVYYGCSLLFITEFAVLTCYLVCIPSSPFFYYFSLFTFIYKGFLLWPMKRFIDDHTHHQPRYIASERTRLLASVA